MFKIPTLFNKIPKHKRFNYAPRHYDPMEEERREREERIRQELQLKESETVADDSYRTRISGSFRTSRKTQGRQLDPSANMLRLIIITLLVGWFFAYLQYGNIAMYGLLLIIPLYLWIKFVRK
jgi:Flp pilus assembly protein TadB